MTDDTSPAADAAPVSGPNPAATRRLVIYYALLVTQTVSLIGSQIGGYAVSIAVFRESGHATPLALVAFFSVLPAVVLGGFAGAVADRFDRRTTMLIANVGFVVTSALLLASFVSGAFQLWHLYVLTFASAAFATFERTAFQACVAMLVPDSHRDRANAIAQMTQPVAGVVAPAAAGLLYALLGVPGSIGINVATFLAAIVVLAAVRIPRPVQSAEGRAMQAALWRQVFDGFRYLAARPALLGFCLFISLVNFVANTVMVLLTPYALARTGSAQMFGAVLAAMNAGGVAGSLAISAGARVGSRMDTVMLGLVGGSLFLGLAGVAQSVVAIGASLFAMMFFLSFNNAPFWSMMQAKVAPDLQGRVFAAYIQLIIVMAPAAFLIAGPLADKVFEPARQQAWWRNAAWLVGSGPGAGMGLMFVVAGLLLVAGCVAIYAVPAVRRMEADLPDHSAV